MGIPSFKECIAADVSNVFLNRLEFADTHAVDGREMTILIDDNELMERDQYRAGTHQDGTYISRRLVYVSKEEFGPRPAQGRQIRLDGRLFRVEDCTEEAGLLAIELKAVRT